MLSISLSQNQAQSRLRVGMLGATGHGKTTLLAAMTRVLAGMESEQNPELVEQFEQIPYERERALSIAYTEAKYSWCERQYAHIDYHRHTDSIKGLLAIRSPLDGAVIVVSATEGPVPQTREHILLASRLQIPAVMIFLNKMDLAQDEELLAVVELELRELLATVLSPDEAWPMIRGSALTACTSQSDLSRSDSAVQSIWALLDMMHVCLPTPLSARERPFLMTIEEISQRKQGELLALGYIERGYVQIGECLDVVGLDREIRTVTITGIEMRGKKQKRAVVGERLVCLVSGSEHVHLERSCVLVAPGTFQPCTAFQAQVYVLTPAEGGRHTPFYNGYRTCFHIRGTDIVGEVKLSNDVEKALPGDHLQITVRVILPVALEAGQHFTMREGGRVVIVGVCTHVINM